MQMRGGGLVFEQRDESSTRKMRYASIGCACQTDVWNMVLNRQKWIIEGLLVMCSRKRLVGAL